MVMARGPEVFPPWTRPGSVHRTQSILTFGSVKANPWWGSVLMPIVFLMSAIVSGIALVIFLYMVLTAMRRETIDMRCLDTITSYLFYAVIVDFSLEALDFYHRLYQSEESVKILASSSPTSCS